MRAIRTPRSWPVRLALIFAAYIALIIVGNSMLGCAAPAVDLDGDGIISPDEMAIDFEERYATLRSLVRLGVAVADPDEVELARVNAILAAADDAAAQYAADLRDGIQPGSALSNRRIARGLLETLTEYIERGEAAAAETPE